MANDTKTATPPYFSILQLKNFVKQLAETSVPIKIDKGVIGSLSGSAQAALMSGIRYLGLVSDDGTTKDALRNLVDGYKAGETQWKRALRASLDAAYKDVVQGVDLEHGTWKTLESAFINTGVREGQMSEKCTRFFVTAMVETGATVSHYITKAKNRTTNSGPKTGKKRSPKGASPGDDGNGGAGGGDDATPQGYIDQPVPLPGRPVGTLIRFPVDLTASECAFLEHAIAGVKLYAQAQKGGPE